jgi:transcriptional regulator with XRE-family HTH domain
MTTGTPKNDIEREDFAALLRAARAFTGLGQAEVADRLGVSRATVSAWERGYTPVPSIARVGVVQGLIDLGADPRFFSEEGRDDR